MGRAGGGFDAPFAGFWSNGWHSTGVLTGAFDTGIGSFSGLNITTEKAPSPEASTFLMLGAGFLHVIRAVRRTLRR